MVARESTSNRSVPVQISGHTPSCRTGGAGVFCVGERTYPPVILVYSLQLCMQRSIEDPQREKQLEYIQSVAENLAAQIEARVDDVTDDDRGAYEFSLEVEEVEETESPWSYLDDYELCGDPDYIRSADQHRQDVIEELDWMVATGQNAAVARVAAFAAKVNAERDR